MLSNPLLFLYIESTPCLILGINFFISSVHKSKHNDDKTERTWVDNDGSTIPIMEIKAKKLFNKECIEPMKLRIIIEQIEE